MSKQWQIRRGTTAENDSFTGAIGELTMDTDKKQIRLHDGATEGGISIMAEKDTVGYCSFNTDTRIQITNTDQTATKNGWLIGYIAFNGNNINCDIVVDNIIIGRYGWSINNGPWFGASIQMPIKAGQRFRYSCSAVQDNKMYFYPNN